MKKKKRLKKVNLDKNADTFGREFIGLGKRKGGGIEGGRVPKPS